MDIMPPQMVSYNSCRWLVFDTEFIARYGICAFLQFAAQLFYNQRVWQRESFYFRSPVQSLPKWVVKYTGITSEKLATGYPPEQGLQKMLAVLMQDDLIYVGHGIQSDFRLLFKIIYEQFPHLVTPAVAQFYHRWYHNQLPIYDTQLAAAILSGQSAKRPKLQVLMERYDIVLNADYLHAADFDVAAILAVFQQQVFLWLQHGEQIPLYFDRIKPPDQETAVDSPDGESSA